jgi:hypothetical protein
MAAKKKTKRKTLTPEERAQRLASSEEKYPTKKVLGRPPLYDPAFCQIVFNIMGAGASISTFCAEIGIGRNLALEWAKKYPDFKVACDAGKEAAQKWWEALAMQVATGQASTHAVYKKANYGMIMFMMSRRFPDYYQKTRIEGLKGSGGDGDQDGIRALNKMERMQVLKKFKNIIDELDNEDGD